MDVFPPSSPLCSTQHLPHLPSLSPQRRGGSPMGTNPGWHMESSKTKHVLPHSVLQCLAGGLLSTSSIRSVQALLASRREQMYLEVKGPLSLRNI